MIIKRRFRLNMFIHIKVFEYHCNNIFKINIGTFPLDTLKENFTGGFKIKPSVNPLCKRPLHIPERAQMHLGKVNFCRMDSGFQTLWTFWGICRDKFHQEGRGGKNQEYPWSSNLLSRKMDYFVVRPKGTETSLKSGVFGVLKIYN